MFLFLQHKLQLFVQPLNDIVKLLTNFFDLFPFVENLIISYRFVFIVRRLTISNILEITNYLLLAWADAIHFESRSW